MTSKHLLAFLASLSIAASANAGGWSKTAGGTDTGCKFPSPNKCFYDFAADETTPVLAVDMCENFSIWFDSDTLATTNDTTVKVYWSSSASTSSLTSEILDTTLLDGNGDTGTDRLTGNDGIWIYADIITHSAGDVARMIVQCFPF